jgi:serine/threonine-protein kinase
MAGFTKLGKYLIRRELGKGAMGVVYEGFDPVIERTVAIKTILPAQLSSEEASSVLARFKREAQAAGRLNHPNIVAIYDYGEVVAEDDRTMVAAPSGAAQGGERVAFIAMEFIKGRELRDFFEANERFPLKEVDRIMGEMLGALAHAHANGVVHRDMKPANVMVLDGGAIKVADFGIARVEKSELTQAGTVMGTPSYMSPEQFMGQTVDGRSDIFSCGVILYQFLTGEKPFTGNTTTIMYKVLREEPLAPSMLNVALPAAFDAVVKKAMAKNPDERYQTAQEFANAIKAAVAGQGKASAASMEQTVINPASDATLVNTVVRPAPAAPAPVPAPATPMFGAASTPAAIPPVPAPGPIPGPSAAHAPSKPLSPAVLAIGGVVAVAVLGGAAYLMMNKGGGSSNPQAAAPAPQVAAAPAPAAPAPAAPAPAPAEAAAPEGTVVISAVGLADAKDPNAQEAARADAKRQLVEKATALYVDKGSLDKNYAVLDQKLFSQSGNFIKTTVQEDAPITAKNGWVEAETRAIVKVRDVQKSLNQLSKDERISFIRNNGDPKVAVQMTVRSADNPMPPNRSAVAENVVKERVKSFGFRVWSNEGDAKTGPNAKAADFQLLGEAALQVKPITIQGLQFTKTLLTSWTVKAIDKATGEEIYLNTIIPEGKNWKSDDEALAAIGKLMGDEFSKNFFLEHFNYGTQKISLNISGLPDAEAAKLLLREMRSVRQVLDAQMDGDGGKYQLQLADGSASDIIQDGLLKPLNSKMGQACFALGGATGSEVNVSFSAACAQAAVRAKLESGNPAGLMNAPEARKALLKGGKVSA